MRDPLGTGCLVCKANMEINMWFGSKYMDGIHDMNLSFIKILGNTREFEIRIWLQTWKKMQDILDSFDKHDWQDGPRNDGEMFHLLPPRK